MISTFYSEIKISEFMRDLEKNKSSKYQLVLHYIPHVIPINQVSHVIPANQISHAIPFNRVSHVTPS